MEVRRRLLYEWAWEVQSEPCGVGTDERLRYRQELGYMPTRVVPRKCNPFVPLLKSRGWEDFLFCLLGGIGNGTSDGYF